jgi:hypothetical protein
LNKVEKGTKMSIDHPWNAYLTGRISRARLLKAAMAGVVLSAAPRAAMAEGGVGQSFRSIPGRHYSDATASFS